eukprot:31155-Pelagococcus_subviridis.AAC.8
MDDRRERTRHRDARGVRAGEVEREPMVRSAAVAPSTEIRKVVRRALSRRRRLRRVLSHTGPHTTPSAW